MKKIIKNLDISQVDKIMEIWLEANIAAHSFIPAKYWLDNYSVVKEQYLPVAKTFTYQERGIIQGFISILDGFFVGALFVAKAAQGQGRGLALMNYCKSLYAQLELAVYVENKQAVIFYRKCGFEIIADQLNKDSGHQEYLMSWTNSCRHPE